MPPSYQIFCVHFWKADLQKDADQPLFAIPLHRVRMTHPVDIVLVTTELHSLGQGNMRTNLSLDATHSNFTKLNVELCKNSIVRF